MKIILTSLLLNALTLPLYAGKVVQSKELPVQKMEDNSSLVGGSKGGEVNTFNFGTGTGWGYRPQQQQEKKPRKSRPTPRD